MFTKYKSEKIFKRIFFNHRHSSLPSKPSSHAHVTPTVTFSSSLGSVTSAVNVVKRFFFFVTVDPTKYARAFW